MNVLVNRKYTVKFLLALTLAVGACCDTSRVAWGVDSDILFSYVDDQIVVPAENGVIAAEFPVDGLFQQYTGNPGFASESDVGFGINPGDEIVYHVLDDLQYWSSEEFALPNAGTQIRIEKMGAPDTVVSGTSGTLLGSFSPESNNRIGQANGNGYFHEHVDFSLEPKDPSPDPEYGAYGIKIALATDAENIADSEPFFIVFNFGLETKGFVEAVDQFSALLTPPGLSGDFNGDGKVDGVDFLAWQLGESPNGIGSGDLELWRANYGTSSSSAVAQAMVVPEPATVQLLMLLLLGAFFVRYHPRERRTSGRSSRSFHPTGCSR